MYWILNKIGFSDNSAKIGRVVASYKALVQVFNQIGQ